MPTTHVGYILSRWRPDNFWFAGPFDYAPEAGSRAALGSGGWASMHARHPPRDMSNVWHIAGWRNASQPGSSSPEHSGEDRARWGATAAPNRAKLPQTPPNPLEQALRGCCIGFTLFSSSSSFFSRFWIPIRSRNNYLIHFIDGNLTRFPSHKGIKNNILISPWKSKNHVDIAKEHLVNCETA